MKYHRITFFICLIIFLPSLSHASISEIIKIKAESKSGSIQVSWEKPALQETESILLIKKENICPKNYTDGEELYRGNGGKFEDKNVENGKKYCYGIFIYDSSGRISNPNFSGVIEKENGLAYFLRMLQNDYFIFGGVGLIIILFWIDRKNFLLWEEGRKKRRISL